MKNPISKIKAEKGLSITDLAKLAGVGYSTMQNIEKGRPVTINKNILSLIEKLGYDKDQVQAEYQKYRETEQAELLRSVM